MPKKIAIISPNQQAYSETFIQAHRNINAKMFYYYGGAVPEYLDGTGYIGPKHDLFTRLSRFIKRRLKRSNLTIHEEAFVKSLIRNKIDAVLAEYGTTGVAVLNSCKYTKTPLVPIFHGFDASVKQILKNFKDDYLNLFAYSNKVIVVSEVIKQTLIGLGCPEKKIVHTPCAPSDAFLSVTPSFSEPKSFVAIGRFVNKKAPYYTILAIKKVAQKYPNIKLYFAGEGELLETCRNLVRYFNLENNIQLMGRINPEEYVGLLEKVCGFIQHSITAENGDMEGTPVSVLEASAAGIPVVATRHAGIPDVIKDGETGLLVDEHDVNGMAEKIIKLIETKGLAKKLGDAGKERIKKNFSMERHLSVIEEALEGYH